MYIINYIMVKLAVLKNVSLGTKSSFKELENNVIEKYLDNKIEFRDFNNTLDMYYLIQLIFGTGLHIELLLCHYDKNYLIHAFSVDDDREILHNNIVLVKRKINDNDDTYNYSHFDPNIPESDIYQFKDVLISDIVSLIRKKSVINCVCVSVNGTISDDELILLNNNDDVGKILLKNENKEILYLNISNIVNKHHNENEDKIDEIIKEKTEAYCTKYIYTQIDLGFGILNCYCESHAQNKNEKISKMVNYDIYGNAIIFLEIKSKSDDGTETFINLNTDLFSKILNLISNGKKEKRENNYFFNIYRQLS